MNFLVANPDSLNNYDFENVSYYSYNIDSDEYISSIMENQGVNVGKIATKNIQNLSILKIYFSKWKDHVLKPEIDLKKSSDDRSKMIDDFFVNVLKKKNECLINKEALQQPESTPSQSSSSDNIKGTQDKFHYEKFHNRYQAQKNIIALQKLKLQHQERIIDELKLKKYVEDNNLSNNNLITDVRKTLQNCDRNHKPKLKCLAGENAKQDEDNGDVIIPYCVKVPKFIQQMEQRARQREEKRAIVRERRRQMELEKQRAKEQMELEKQIMDQDEKNRRLNEYKEKRKQEQLIAIRRKEMRDKMRALMVMADLHYEKKITIKYGPNAFRLYLQKIKEDNELATKHSRQNVMKIHFNAWKKYTEEVLSRRTEIANNLFESKLLSRSFYEIKMIHRTMVKKRQVAEDWYEFHITERLFILWRHNTRKIKYQRKKQWSLAIQHYNFRLLWKAIGCWQTLPTINRLEREQEARKHKWRLKVQQVLPDFIPISVEDMDDAKYI